MAPMATTPLPKRTRQISRANVIPSPTGVPLFLADCQNMIYLQVRWVLRSRVSSLYMSCATCQGAQIYSFVLMDSGLHARIDCRRVFVLLQVGRVAYRVQQYRCGTVSLTLTFDRVSISRFTESIERYPHDIPNGTAIPSWAFINVAVRHTSNTQCPTVD